jgi:hypothetical protein
MSNATVKLIGVDHSQIQLENADDLDERADDLLEEARNAKPPSWEKDLDLTGSSGLFGDVSSEYPAVHSAQDWGLEKWEDTTSLGDPLVQVPANQPVVLSAWDPTKSSLIESEVNSDLPGKTTESDIQLTYLDATGDTLKTETIPLSQTYQVGVVTTSEHQYAKVELSPGFYEISVNGSDVSYTIVAGNPDEITAEVAKDLRNRADQLSEQAKNARQQFEDGKFTATTVTTNENGSFSVSLPENVKTVSATAYKVPQGMDPENATRADIREFYNTMNITRSTSDADEPFAVTHHGITREEANLTAAAELDEPVPAFYLPDGSTETDVPAGNVTLDVYKTDVPTLAETQITANRSQLRDWWLSNLSYSDLPPALQDRWNATNATLQEVRDDLYNVTQANEELRRQVEELLAQQRNTTVEEVRVSLRESDKGREALLEEVAALREIIAQQDATVTIPDPEVERSESAESVSLSWSVPGELDSGNFSVLANYANGTTRTVGDEHISVDQGSIPGQSTVVRVSEYPLGASDPSSVQFELQAASAEGWGSSQAVVKNPTFDGELPSIDSVSVSSVAPGPSENVTVRVSPSESGSWKRLTNVSAIGPDGSSIGTSSIEDGRRLSFTTNGEGVHTLRLTAETTNGEEVVIPVRVKAVGREVDQSPTLSVKESAVGEYVLTSGEFERAEVSTENARQQVTVTAQLPSGDEVPNEVDVHLEEIATPSSSSVSVQLVRGESEESVSQHVPVQIHMSATTDDVLLWRNGNAVSRDGGQWGKAELQGDQLVLKTYTDSNGDLEISKENDPGLIASVSHGFSRLTQSFALVVSFAIDAISFAWTPGSALATPTPAPVVAGTADAVGPALDAGALEEVIA